MKADIGGFFLKLTDQGVRVDEGLLMIKKHVFVGDRHHIIVEPPGIDGLRVLLDKMNAAFLQLVQPGDGGRGFIGLPPGEFFRRHAFIESLAAIDEKMQAGITVIAAKTVVVGCPFIAEMHAAGQRRVMGKKLFIREYGFQHAGGGLGLETAVVHRRKISRGDMQPAVSGIGGGRHGGGIGGPHGRRGINVAQNRWRLVGRFGDDFLVCA